MWFGPGTVLALLALGTLLVLGNLNHQRDGAAGAGRIVYEADRDGRLRPVDVPRDPNAPSPTRPLWKPEVHLLLERDREIALSGAQRKQIALLDEGWRRDKAGLDASMRDAATPATTAMDHPASERGASLQIIQRGMADYSELSREYDARRTDYWLRATSLLSKPQRDRIERLSLSPAGVQGRAK